MLPSGRGRWAVSQKTTLIPFLCFYTKPLTFMLSFTAFSSSSTAMIRTYNKQLLDKVFVMSGIIKVEVLKCHRPSSRPRLITITVTLIIPDITKIESNDCFIIHCFEINNDKYIVARNQLDIALRNHA